MVSRRDFLALAGGIVVLAACGGSSDDSSSGTTGNTLDHDHPDESFTDLSPIVLSGDLYASAVPQRFAFAMSAKQGFASGGAVTLAVAPQGRILVDDSNLQMRSADELKAELQAGLRRDASDLNPLKMFRQRK